MPKQRVIDLHVPGETPEELAERLGDQVRIAVMPSANQVAALSDKPLRGRVSPSGMLVSLNDTSWLRRVHPTSRLTFTEESGGTRVTGQVGLGPFATWSLRIAFICGVLVTVGLAAAVLTGAVAAPWWVAFLYLAVMGILTPVTGWNVVHADDEMPRLAEVTEDALKGRGLRKNRTVGQVDEAMEKQRKAMEALKRRT